jgi:GcrA cell cycle regulator
MSNQHSPSSNWSPERVVELELLVQSGIYTFTEIAGAMHMSKNQVIGKAYRIGMKGPRSKPESRGSISKMPRTTLMQRLATHNDMFPAPGHCVFPLGDPGEAEFRFCAAETEALSPYCKHHSKVAYRVEKEVVA